MGIGSWFKKWRKQGNADAIQRQEEWANESAAERRLAHDTDGRGWARDTVERLCVDRGLPPESMAITDYPGS